jgi:predicted DsbA family dithiol-disulfide isomerase
MQKLRVDIWSDIACPWCYVGKRRLEAALARTPRRDEVEVVWRAFELDPSAPRVRTGDGPYSERLAKKYGTSVSQADAMIQRMVGVGAEDGIEFRFDKIQPGNTFDAHRVIHFAAGEGAQDAVKERFLRGYLSEGEAIGEPAVLVRLAADAGLDADEVAAVLATDAHARDVRQDEAEAREIGIQGVPFFVLGGRYAVSGAQPADAMLAALDRTFADRKPLEELAEGAACGPEGCG